MSTPAETGLVRWHRMVDLRDTTDLPAALADDVVFHSPALFTPIEGRDAVALYLASALAVLGTDDFAYRRTWQDDTSAALEFTTTLDGKAIHGIDLVEWDADGLIRDFAVMVRPMSGLNVVIEHMKGELTRRLEG